MTGAISQDWESCQFPFVLDEKSAIVPIGSAGERPEARTGSLWRRSVELRVSRAVGLRWQAVFGCHIVWNRSTRRAGARGGARDDRPRWLVDEGQAEEGIEQLSTNLVFYRNAGVALEQPYYLALLAEAFGKAGRIDEGLAELTEALARAHQTGECYYEAELLRIKGELLLSQTTPGVEEAERCFREAIEVARRRRSKSLELRAAMSLSRLWQQQGKKDDARKLLGDIYGWFTEGFETADLKAAKALLNELT